MTAAKNQKTMTTKLTVAAMLTAVAVVLQYIEFSIPIVPSFLKFDFSDLPELIGAFVLAPVGSYHLLPQKPDPYSFRNIGKHRRAFKLYSRSVAFGHSRTYLQVQQNQKRRACCLHYRLACNGGGQPAGQLFCGISGICGYVVRQRYERDRSNVQNAPAFFRHPAQIAFDFQFAVHPRQGSYSFDHHNVYLQAAFKPDRKDEQFVFKEKGRLIAIAVKNNVTQNLKT